LKKKGGEKNMKKLLITVLVCLFTLGMVSTAKATILPVTGGFGTITNVGPSAGYGSGVIANKTIDFVFPKVNGKLIQNVYLNSVGYLFTYQLTNKLSSVDAIVSMSTNDWDSFYTEVDGFLVNSGDDAPHYTLRQLSGDTIDFPFQDNLTHDFGLVKGATSYTLWIQTNAKYYGPGKVHLINGGTHDIDVFGPAIPEPGTMLLLGMGIFGLFGLRKKKIS
jgi:hypothetical protein